MTDESIQDVLSVPYSLEYISTNKRFITELNSDNTTSLIFGNGILRSGQHLSDSFLQVEQVGISVPGNPQDLQSEINPLLGDEYSTLGETPANTTLTVSYRVGGGVTANVSSGDLTTIGTTTYLDGTSLGGNTLTVTNELPARGGAPYETVDEIRHRAMAHFTTQQRCVTKEDYEARVLSMPAQFGNIAKVYVERGNTTREILLGDVTGDGIINVQDIIAQVNTIVYNAATETTTVPTIGTILIHILSYNKNKNLVGDPELLPSLLTQNLKNYLGQYRLITDEISVSSGKIINFGVAFEAIAHKHANKQDVKLKCIQKIIDYFRVEKMQFRQPIYTTELEYELMGVDGVRGINYVELTQYALSSNGETIFSNQLYDLSWNPDTTEFDTDMGTSGYGYFYDFNSFYDGTNGNNGIIYPSVEPSVFELKNPKQNIKGRVL